MKFKERFKPAVNKRFLVFLAGFIWIGVGIMLNSFAASWLITYGRSLSFLFIALGLAGSVSHSSLRIPEDRR